MPISTGAFINGRVGELDLIRAGWRFMQRTMSDQDLQRFEQMINMPGFCVRKFEDTYLLRKINPFAQTPEQRMISFSHLDCGCQNSKDVQEICEMKKQLSEFLEKWEDVFKRLPASSVTSVSPETLLKVDDLQQNTSKQLNKFNEQTPEIKSAENKQRGKVEKVVVEREKPQPKKGNAVAEQCTWNVAHISGKPVHPKETKDIPSTSSKEYIEQANPSIAPKQNAVEKPVQEASQPSAPTKVESTSTPEEVTSLVEVPPVPPTICPQEEPISVACTEETASIHSSVIDDISPSITDTGRTAGTPDSGMISDVSEFKIPETEQKEASTGKPKDPEKMSGRDGRRYRQKLREAEKLAQEQLKLEEASESQERLSTESEPNGSEEAVMTGKEKRRLKDKLRKEKKEQEKLMAVNKENEKETEPAELSEANVAANDTASPIEVECDNKDITELPKQDKTSIADEEPTELDPSEVVTVISEERIDLHPHEEPALGAVDRVHLQTGDGISVNVSEPNNEVFTEVTDDPSPTPDEDVKKMSKRQRRRAQKKANKGVYVVNDRPHSVELLPGEYKIVKLDQNTKIEGLPLEVVQREVNVDEKVEEKRLENNSKQKKRKSYYVAGNLSKDILDNGKWLAYVIDDNHSSGKPRIGEVNTEEVEKTIKLLDTRISQVDQQSQADRYIDDFDYDSIMSNSQADQFVRTILPELDADYVRNTFQRISDESGQGAGEALCYPDSIDDDNETDPKADDLKAFLETEPADLMFKTAFARRTAPLFVGNVEFKEFCQKYSKSKFNPETIYSLIKKYIDTRIVFHYERFKKLADREARRIAKCWTRVTESSTYALMVMLYINNPKSNVGYPDVESALFSEMD